MMRLRDSLRKTPFVYAAAGVCTLAMIIGVFVWSWRVVARHDAAPGRRGLGSQLMIIKTQSMADLRDGLATADYQQLEEAIARLREVNYTAGQYLSENRYGEAGATFRHALEQFRRDVQSRELSKAQRSFQELTASCVACHRGVANLPLDENLNPLSK